MMRWMIPFWLLATFGACHNASEKPQADNTEPTTPLRSIPASGRPPDAVSCARQEFATTLDLPEASAATWMPDASLLVVGDSGTHGAYVRLDPQTGTILSRGTLPLDSGASDDLEGLSRIGSTLYGLTSSGYMREWQRKGDGFALARASYSLATKAGSALTCASATDFNCGPNYEGLCLKPSLELDSPCVGYAASKALGALVCLVQQADGRLTLDPEHTIVVAGPKTLSGCDFDSEQTLWIGHNLFAANSVGIVSGYDDPKSAVITRLGLLGLGNCEAIVAGPADQVFRFSDTSGSSSLLDKYICR